jgi:Flp pilus assembly protein TadG
VIELSTIARRSTTTAGPTVTVGPAARGCPAPDTSDAGASAVELAILLVVIIPLLFASIQVAVYYLASAEALAAAQQGVTVQREYGTADGTGVSTADGFIAHSQGWLVGSTATQTPVTATSTDVTVTVHGTALALLWSIPVTQTAHGTIEIVTPPS